MFGFAIVGCTTDELRHYSYLYCKVRDADPIVHQTIDGLVPVGGAVANAAVSTGCLLIETTTPIEPPKVTVIAEPKP